MGGELQAGLSWLQNDHDLQAAQVRNAVIPLWLQPGIGSSPVAPPGPALTAAGYLLAKAMTYLPEQKVAQTLKSAWTTWLNGHTTDAQLASALGIRLPSVPVPSLPQPQPGMTIVSRPGQQTPLCR
jgi:hypothetical protein